MISPKHWPLIATLIAFLLTACGTATVATDVENKEASPDDQGEGDTAPNIETDGPITKAPVGKTPAMEKKDPPSAEDLACETDEDCVPAECCHPKTCVNKGAKPNCEGMMCTMVCRGGTMDCGGGKCVCQDGKCAAKMNPPRVPGAMTPPRKID